MKVLAAIVVSVACVVAHAAPPQPACDVTAASALSFRAAQSRDTVTVQIRGTPCYEAVLSIRITSDAGKTLYAYEAPFKRHVATDWEDPDLPNAAAKLAKRIVKQEQRKTNSLPPWLPEAEYYEKYYNIIKISKRRYEQLRKQKRPIFTHPTHYEESQSVFYDSSTGRTKLLFEGGV